MSFSSLEGVFSRQLSDELETAATHFGIVGRCCHVPRPNQGMRYDGTGQVVVAMIEGFVFALTVTVATGPIGTHNDDNHCRLLDGHQSLRYGCAPR